MKAGKTPLDLSRSFTALAGLQAAVRAGEKIVADAVLVLEGVRDGRRELEDIRRQTTSVRAEADRAKAQAATAKAEIEDGVRDARTRAARETDRLKQDIAGLERSRAKVAEDLTRAQEAAKQQEVQAERDERTRRQAIDVEIGKHEQEAKGRLAALRERLEGLVRQVAEQEAFLKTLQQQESDIRRRAAAVAGR